MSASFAIAVASDGEQYMIYMVGGAGDVHLMSYPTREQANRIGVLLAMSYRVRCHPYPAEPPPWDAIAEVK